MRRETSDEIDAEAALWAARVDAQEDPALQQWLAGDMRRLGAYARARAALVLIDGARALGPGYDPADFITGDAADEPAPEQARGWSRRGVLALGVPAAAAVGIGAVALRTFTRGDHYATARGEMRRIALPDGSAVTLNTDSAVRVAFTDTRRDVSLEAGEALFEVAKDPSRPFVVNAGGARVRAIGTAFSVRRAQTGVRIVVQEGVVEMARPGAAPPVRLARDMLAEVASDAAVTVRHGDADAVTRELSWREGRIALSDTALADAAVEFARYSDTRIEIPDPAVAQQRISGLYVATDPQGFAEAVALGLGLHAHREGKVIRLTGS